MSSTEDHNHTRCPWRWRYTVTVTHTANYSSCRQNSLLLILPDYLYHIHFHPATTAGPTSSRIRDDSTITTRDNHSQSCSTRVDVSFSNDLPAKRQSMRHGCQPKGNRYVMAIPHLENSYNLRIELLQGTDHFRTRGCHLESHHRDEESRLRLNPSNSSSQKPFIDRSILNLSSSTRHEHAPLATLPRSASLYIFNPSLHPYYIHRLWE